jgi:L-iditol 2-dehydrogenase
MTIAELYDHRKFRMAEAAIEDPGPGEVQVRVHSVGICGSDVHNFSEGGIGDTPAAYPMVLGHEPTGEVLKTGAGVTGWSRGDKAVLEPAIYCYHCEFCRTGHHNVCANIRFLSTPGIPGFFRQFVNLPAKNLLPIPEPLDMHQATLFEPFAVILHSLHLGDVKPGESAAVFGAGPIGLLTVIGLKLAGAGRVWCVDPIAERRDLAKHLGADVVLGGANTDAAREILSDTGKRGVDVVFDCATKGNSMDQSLEAARAAGRVVLTGIPSEIRVSLNFHLIRRKELSLFTVRRSNHETDAALKLMREYPSKFAAVVTHTRPIDKIQSAFEMLERYEDGVGKLVLTFPNP